MALCGHQAGWPCRRASGDAAGVRSLQVDAGEVRPQRRTQDRATDAARLVRPVHCKSITAQEIRAMLTARKLVQSKLLDLENSLRGILRGFGLKVGKTTRTGF